MRQVYILLTILCSSLSAHLWAQDYKTGLARYLQNEFPSAEGIFQNLLAGEMPNKERSQTVKLLGLSQYMQGKRAEAAESFKQAKKLSPNIRIQNSEVLDETVLDFFNSIEGPAPSAATEAEPKKKKKEPSPEVFEKKPEATPTTVLILSNAIDGQVLIDGFFRGKVGDIIPLDPGIHNFEVYADSYQNEVQSLNIAYGTLNKFTFKLQKLTAAPKVLAKTEAAPPPKVEHKEERPKKLHHKKKKKKPEPPKQEEMAEGLYFIPFGVPQYLQGKAWTGLSFTLLQAAGAGYFVSQYLQANQVSDDTNRTVDSRDAQETQITDPTERKNFDAATDAYYSSQLSQIQTLRTQAYIGLSVFVLAWLGSGIEAYYNPPAPPALPKNQSGEFRRQGSSWSWFMNPSYLPAKSRTSRDSYALNLDIRF